MLELSLIVPCFNEANNLSRLVDAIAQGFSENEVDVEIILVDNGSTDATQEIIENLIEPHPFIRSCRVDTNRGYGFGILTGLNIALGEILAWTHADLQTDPTDVLEGLKLFRQSSTPENLFVKGSRYGRPFQDRMFTLGMAVFESLLLGIPMREINAQPTMFHRNFYISWQQAPEDALLDLFAYSSAIRSELNVERFPVYFGRRMFGIGQNDSLDRKIRNSWRTMIYSLQLRRRINNKRNRSEK